MELSERKERANALRDAIIDLITEAVSEFEAADGTEENPEARRHAYEIVLNGLGQAAAGAIASMTDNRQTMYALLETFIDGTEENMRLLAKRREAFDVEA